MLLMVLDSASYVSLLSMHYFKDTLSKKEKECLNLVRNKIIKKKTSRRSGLNRTMIFKL